MSDVETDQAVSKDEAPAKRALAMYYTARIVMGPAGEYFNMLKGIAAK